MPRRGLFDPTRWETTQTEVKNRLLGVIGMVRSTTGISRNNFAGLDVVHDLWRDRLDAQLPVLWAFGSAEQFSLELRIGPRCTDRHLQ